MEHRPAAKGSVEHVRDRRSPRVRRISARSLYASTMRVVGRAAGRRGVDSADFSGSAWRRRSSRRRRAGPSSQKHVAKRAHWLSKYLDGYKASRRCEQAPRGSAQAIGYANLWKTFTFACCIAATISSSVRHSGLKCTRRPYFPPGAPLAPILNPALVFSAVRGDTALRVAEMAKRPATSNRESRA